MPMPSHLWLEGETQGAIDGSCTQAGRENSILVQALDHDVTIPRSPQDGQPTGKRVHSPLTITKVFDASSPKLYQALCTGERINKFEIKFYRINDTGNEEHYFTIALERAIVVDMKSYYPNCLDAKSEQFRHMEDASFTYEKIIWTWEIDGIVAEDSWQVPV